MYAFRRPIMQAAFAACSFPAVYSYCDDNEVAGVPQHGGRVFGFDALKNRRKKSFVLPFELYQPIPKKFGRNPQKF